MRFTRFQKLKEKVLLNDGEAREREKILSDSKMIGWVESQLINPKSELPARFLLIDVLEDAIAWKENPIRQDSAASIERLIRSEGSPDATKADKRVFVGDKIELFAILFQEFPERAETLLSQAKGTPLEEILNYAKKRLSLKKPTEESR